MTAPAEAYGVRLEARKASVAALDRRDLQISRLRLLAFAAILAVVVMAWRGTASPLWTAVPILAFAALVIRHDSVLRARDAMTHAVQFYVRGLDRIHDKWIGTGETGERFRDDEHLYANDLDLFGPASLYELLSVARTQSGEETLAAWLKQPADPGEIPLRQQAVRELTPALDLREALAVSGGRIKAGVHSEALIAWAERPSVLRPRVTRWIAVLLTMLAVLSIVLLFQGQVAPLVFMLIGQGMFRAWQRTQIDAVLHSTAGYVRELTMLRHVLTHVEGATFSSDRLITLQRSIDQPGAPAYAVIRRLERLVEAHDWEHNLVFTPVAALLAWGTHLAWAIEDWREQHGTKIAAWLTAVGEIEALSSFATYAFEHPEDPFPVLVAARDGDGAVAERRAQLDGRGLGHPLLPRARMVPNDVTLDEDRRLLVISGSNMSGKSTLLRTVGVNVVLALAGAPVRARSLTLSPVGIGATLRIQDSLLEGRSRFYAEITRVRAIVDAARLRPLLFLLDELFHGTNSHDRFVGATGVLRNLIDLGAIGLVTTHDLALTGIATELAPRAENVHFEDEFDGRQMLFDYRMKLGPVTRSNALALMRAVGLEIDPHD